MRGESAMTGVEATYADPWIRLVALLIDVIILGVIRSIISPIAGEDLGEFGPITGIAGVVISAIYYIVAIGQ